MNVRKRAALFLAMIAAAAQAQPDSLTLAQCITRALEHNANVRVARSELRGAQRHRDALEATRQPRIDAGAHVLWAPANGYDSLVTNGGEVAAQVGAQWPLYDGGARSVALDQSAVDIERARWDGRLTDRDIVFETAAAFHSLALAERERALFARSVAQLDEYLALTTRLRSGGAAEQTDVLKTQIQRTSALIARRDSEHRIRDATAALAVVLGQTTSPVIRDTVPLDTSYAPPAVRPATLEERMAQLDVQHAMFDVSLARTERNPLVNLAADAGALTSFENLRAQSGLHNVFGYSALAEVKVPLWNGGATERRAEELQTAVDALQAHAELLTTALDAEWASAREEYLSAKDAYAQLGMSIVAADDNYKLSTLQYSGGRSSSLEVLDAQRLLTETTIEAEQARTRLLIARARLDRLATQ